MKTKSLFRRCIMASLVAIMCCTQAALAEAVNSDTSGHKQEIKSRKMVVAVPDGSDSYKVVLSDKTILDVLLLATDNFKGWTHDQKTIERIKPPVLEHGEDPKEWLLKLTGISKTGQEVVAVLHLKLSRKNLVGTVRTRS